jgi:hypothetical protein
MEHTSLVKRLLNDLDQDGKGYELGTCPENNKVIRIKKEESNSPAADVPQVPEGK